VLLAILLVCALVCDCSLGKELSKKEKDLISKSIIDLEEKIANLKLSIK